MPRGDGTGPAGMGRGMGRGRGRGLGVGRFFTRGGQNGSIRDNADALVVPVAVVDPEMCTGCGRCAEICPADAIKIGSKAIIDPERCRGCGACINVCPKGAITMAGR